MINHTMQMNLMLKCFETTTTSGQVVRIYAKDVFEAHQKLKELHGPRNVPFIPKMVPS
jgi:hypothetical protein